MTFWRSFLISFLIILLLAGAFGAGYLVRDRTSATANFAIFNQAYGILKSQGIKEMPTPPALEYGLIRGMVQAYNDPYTVFVEPAQHELESNTLQGSYGGIGVRMGNDPEGNWVLYPYPDGPAKAAGVQEGDRLLAVGSLTVTPQTPADDIQAAVRGPVGEKVDITIGRAPGYDPQTYSIKRAEIALPSVTYHLDVGESRLGVLEVNIIAASTASEIEKAVKDLQSRGATHFVLDVRNNPGGLLNSGVDIVRLFLKDGVVIEQQYRGQNVEQFKVEKPGPLADLPLAVLINKGSASAAEIIAGALQGQKRAVLIGEQSYGKNTIQLVYDLIDGSSLHVTAAHWWVPGLNLPKDGQGLVPDIPIPPSDNPTGPDPAIQAAIAALLKK